MNPDRGEVRLPTGLEGVRICLLRHGDIKFDKRLQAFSNILGRAGANVVVVCNEDTSKGSWRESERVELLFGGAFFPSQHKAWLPRVIQNLWRERVSHRSLSRLAEAACADAIIAVNLDSLPYAIRIAQGAPVVYDSQEHFPSTGSITRIRRWAWGAKERRYISRAATVLTVSQPIADDLVRRYRIAPPIVIYNGCSDCAAEPSEIHTPLRLIHQGKLFFDRHVNDIIKAVTPLRGLIELTIQGWGEAEDELRELIRDQGLEDFVRIIPPCEPSEVTECASRHDVGLISLWPTTQSLLWSAPNKLFDYLGGGLAVLSADLPAISEILREEGCGVTYPAGDVQALRSLIEMLASSPDLVMSMKEKALAAGQRYAWDSQSGEIVNVVRSAIEVTRAQGRTLE